MISEPQDPRTSYGQRATEVRQVRGRHGERPEPAVKVGGACSSKEKAVVCFAFFRKPSVFRPEVATEISSIQTKTRALTKDTHLPGKGWFARPRSGGCGRMAHHKIMHVHTHVRVYLHARMYTIDRYNIDM